MAVTIISKRGEQSVIPMAELHSSGVPTVRGIRKRTVRLKLSELQRCSADDYLNAFGFNCTKNETNHTVFRYVDARRGTWVIPALVLMRAIFKPHRLLLERAFFPQAFELLAVGVRGPRASPRCLLAGTREVRDKKYNPTPILTWFWRDRRAWAMACSVHRHAMGGRLDLDLADVEVEIGMRGIENQKMFFATNASIRTVYISSEVEGEAPVQFTLNAAAFAGTSTAGLEKALRVYAGPDGRITTNEAEWAVLAKSLKSKVNCGPRDSKRIILDGLLKKISGQVLRWRDLEKHDVSWELHAMYYRQWLASGELESMLDKLRILRSTDSPSPSRRVDAAVG